MTPQMIAPTSNDASRWRSCIRRCIQERICPARFDKLVARLDRQDLPRRAICRYMLNQCVREGGPVDPLILQYIQHLVSSGYVFGFQLIRTLFEGKDDGWPTLPNGTSDAPKRQPGAAESSLSQGAQVAILRLIGSTCLTQGAPKTSKEAHGLLRVLTDWLSTICEADASSLNDFALLDDVKRSDLEVQVMLASMLASFSENEQVKRCFSVGFGAELKETLPIVLSKVIVSLDGPYPQLASQLDFIQHSNESLQPPALPNPGSGDDNDINIEEQRLQSLPERMPLHARSSTAVYLDGLTESCLKQNIDGLINYLRARHIGNPGESIIDLVVSTFDLLAQASNRGDLAGNLFTIRSLLVNTVPTIIARLSSLLYGGSNASYMIVEAIHRLDPGIQLHTGFEDGFDMTGGPSGLATYGEAMADFVNACMTMGLVAAENVQHIANSYKFPLLQGSTRLDKRRLLKDLKSKPQAMSDAVHGLEAMDGNVVARAEAIGEVLHSRLASQSRHTLKPIYHLLATRPRALDALLLNVDTTSVLESLCKLLDGWTSPKDRSDSHADFLDFGAALTLLLVISHRYGWDRFSLVKDEASFVSWLFTYSEAGPLSEKQGQVLADWTSSLFEAESIPDELLSRCSPQEFYRVVPMIFTQAGLAYSNGILTKPKVQNGLELLQQVVVLPSLAIGLPSLVQLASLQPDSLDRILEMMQMLLSVASTEEDAPALHAAIVSSVKERLEQFINPLEAVERNNLDLVSLKQRLSGLTPCRTASGIAHQSFSNNEPTQVGLLQQFGFDFEALCAWNDPSMSQPLPRYAHRDLRTLIQIRGAGRVLRSLIDMVSYHTLSAPVGESDVSLDVAASIIYAHDATMQSLGEEAISLRRALKLERDNAALLSKEDPHRAEVIVYLYRQVEAQLAPQPSLEELQAQAPPPMDDDNLPAVIEAMAQDQQMMDFDGSMDISFDDPAFFPQPQVANAQAQGANLDFPQAQQPALNALQQQKTADALDAEPDLDQLFGNNQDSNDVFGGSNLFDGAQDEASKNGQNQDAAPTGGDNVMTDDDFWASLGI